MAIQEIEVSNHGSTTTGFKREINESAMGLILDTIQITQYTKPEESTVRELTANAVDSQREKEIAISILSGKSNPEDHFIEREGAKYKDSNWNPNYYDLKYLNEDEKNVILTYTKNSGVGYCDSFSVKDYGVGLGEDRLVGYFQLGFSTKRNSKDSLGAFGFGNKVALSTRCDYYTMVTIHNGKRFKFNCYAYKIDSLIGRFNLESNTENKYITVKTSSGEIDIYYEETTEKNMTEIIVPVKRHNRQKYEQAVKSQLLYFQNVSFFIIEENGYESDKSDFRAQVLYNSDKIIISDNYQYSRPHIVITKGEGDTSTGVCYGFIDFKEMEMQELYGNVGVKCPIRSVIKNEETGEEIVLQEGVEVIPSRESVVWSEHTRSFIINRFKEVVNEANEIVKTQLNTDGDFLTWVSNVSSILNNLNYSDNKILKEMSKVIDKSSLRPFYKNTPIKFSVNPEMMFFGFKLRLHKLSWDNAKRKNVIKRFDLNDWSNFNNNLFIKSVPTSFKTDLYIHNLYGDFITIEYKSEEELNNDRRTYYLGNESKFEKKMQIVEAIKEEFENATTLKNYDLIVVPDDISKKFDEEEIIEAQSQISAADRRKALGQIALHVMCENESYERSRTASTNPYIFKQFDTALADVLDFEGLIVYGFLEDSDGLMFAGDLLRHQFKNSNRWSSARDNDQFNNETIKIIRINKAHEKHFRNNKRFVHITNFFQQVENID